MQAENPGRIFRVQDAKSWTWVPRARPALWDTRTRMPRSPSELSTIEEPGLNGAVGVWQRIAAAPPKW